MMMRWYRCDVCSFLSAFHAKTSLLCVGLANTLNACLEMRWAWKYHMRPPIFVYAPSFQWLVRDTMWGCATLKCNWKIICMCDTCNTQNSCKNFIETKTWCILRAVLCKAVHREAHNLSKANIFLYSLKSTHKKCKGILKIWY